jgi:hypothetical protein
MFTDRTLNQSTLVIWHEVNNITLESPDPDIHVKPVHPSGWFSEIESNAFHNNQS